MSKKKKITATTKIPLDEREKRVWKNSINNLIDKVGEDRFATAFYARIKDRRDEYTHSKAVQEFLAIMDAKEERKEKGFE